MELPMAMKGIEGNGQVMDIMKVDKAELEKAKANNMMVSTLDKKAIEVSAPIPESPMKTEEEP